MQVLNSGHSRRNLAILNDLQGIALWGKIRMILNREWLSVHTLIYWRYWNGYFRN